MTIRERIDASAMSPYQWLIIGLCTLLNALDGFDVLAMAFTANRVSADFALNGAQLGVLLSSGLLGMAAGSLLLAPFADVIGRRPMTILATALAAVGMFLSATAHSAVELGAWRFLTGLGVGGILACTNVIASEYSSRRGRGMSVAIYTAGYGVGATLGGMAAVGLQAAFGWRSVFVLGGTATAPSASCWWPCFRNRSISLLPERPARALERLNRIGGRIGQPASAETARRGPRQAPGPPCGTRWPPSSAATAASRCLCGPRSSPRCSASTSSTAGRPSCWSRPA